MEARGVFRRLDDLGRIVIPKEIRRQIYGAKDASGECFEIILMKDDSIVLKPVREEKEEGLTKDRLLTIARTGLQSLIEMDMDNDCLLEEYGSFDDYCKEMFNASRKEIEEIIGKNIEELR